MESDQKPHIKQSVARKRQQKRKKKFKGTQKQFIRKENPAVVDASAITFVCDDDVVSEQVPPPKPTISSRKLSDVATEIISDEESFEFGGEIATGYRIVSMDSLLKFAIRLHKQTPCASERLELKESSTQRFGMSSSITVSCCDCGMSEFLATGDHVGTDTCPKAIQGKDINRRIVFASNEVGIGREGIAKLCELLNMPFSLSKATWYSHEGQILNAHKEVAMEILAENRKEARLEAMKEQDLAENDDDDEELIVDVPVSFDGTWPKRGFTSNHGVGFTISASTGKVLDYEVISKVCSQCNQKKSSLNENDFELWLEEHECKGDYMGTSGSMELECAKRIWGRSQEYDLRYKFMITDGDSKAYSAIWDIYGVCDTCRKYETMPETDKEYTAWRESDDYVVWEQQHLDGTANCDRVMKLDCIGHVQKRLGKALYNFQKTASKLEDGKPAKGKAGRLTKTAIEKLKKNYGKAIRDNVNKEVATPEERDLAVKQMKNDIKAGLYHSLKIPDEERHQFCKPNSWCKFKKGLPCKDKPHHLDAVFKEHLDPIYERLSDPSLLKRCLPGYTQNANESINGLVWSRCPKSKWFGRNRVELATSSAAIHFSKGATAKHQVMEKAGLEVGKHTRAESTRRDVNRVKQAEKKSSERYKKYRVERRQARQRDDELRRNQEGVTYEAGAFNELSLCAKPQNTKKKRKTK